MHIVTATEARQKLIAEEDWNSVQETLYLLSIPGMGRSIKEGLKTPISDCQTELNW